MPLRNTKTAHLSSTQRNKSALIELGILFLPSIPALIWLWPNIDGTAFYYPVQCLVYIYFLGGALFIGLRRWTWEELGLSMGGIVLSLACSTVLLIERFLAPLALGIPLDFQPFALWRIIGEILFYFGMVGAVEELLFRGLVYQIFDSWYGPGLAIFCSSLGFALWHIGWMGPLIIAPFFLGIIFGLIRWRTGNIAGLILVHGAFDLLGIEMPLPISFSTIIDQVLQHRIAYPWAIVIGDTLMIAIILYLWKVHPRLQQMHR